MVLNVVCLQKKEMNINIECEDDDYYEKFKEEISPRTNYGFGFSKKLTQKEMGTKIKTIKGSCHVHDHENLLKVNHRYAEVHLNRFYNGKENGTNIQLTVQSEYGTSYIHLNKEQCYELAQALNDCFDYEKYPSE